MVIFFRILCLSLTLNHPGPIQASLLPCLHNSTIFTKFISTQEPLPILGPYLILDIYVSTRTCLGPSTYTDWACEGHLRSLTPKPSQRLTRKTSFRYQNEMIGHAHHIFGCFLCHLNIPSVDERGNDELQFHVRKVYAHAHA